MQVLDREVIVDLINQVEISVSLWDVTVEPVNESGNRNYAHGFFKMLFLGVRTV